MQEFRVDYNCNLEDFQIMEKIESDYFKDENITPAVYVMKLYQKNNLTCITVRNDENKVIASTNILPLKKEIFNGVYNNTFDEVNIGENEILEYEYGKSYYIYLSAISIDKKYRNNMKVLFTLLKGCINLFDILKEKHINIEKVMADASTIHGKKLCEKLLNLEYVTNTDHDSKIYCADGRTVINRLERIRKFLS